MTGERQPLIDRYKATLEEIKGRYTRETSREFAKRGVPVSSGIVEQTTGERIVPVEREFRLGEEADLRDIQNQISNLTQQRVEAERAVRNQIAQLQAGGANQAVTDAATLYAQQQDRAFQSRLDDLNKQLLQAQIIKEQQATSPYLTIGPGETLYDINKRLALYQGPYKPTTGAKDEWD